MNILRKTPAKTFYSYAFLPACFVLFFILNTISYGKGAPDSFSELVEKLSPSVVNITTSSTVPNRQELNPQLPPGSPFEDLFRDFMDREQNGSPRRQRRGTALGSGFIISSDGYVVTNNHVIENADQIEIEFFDGRLMEASVVGTDPKTDIALLKVKAKDKLKFVSFGDSNKSKVGDWVLAIGNPLGQGFSVSAGIISARGRALSGSYDDFIQTDAAINRGNSGGPLFNMDGDVIGVNTAILSPNGGSIGIGFSMSSAVVEKVIDQLKAFGETRRGWLGVRIQMVTDEIADSFGLKDTSGALVAEVSQNGPAKKAGIKPGDVILTFNGKKVEAMRRLPRIVAETPIGIDVSVELWRSGKKIKMIVRIGELEEDAVTQASEKRKTEDEKKPKSVKLNRLGLSLEDMNSRLREKFSIDAHIEGVVVTKLDPNGLAAEKGVRLGDVLVEVDQTKVRTAVVVKKLVTKIIESKNKKSVLFTINRQGSIRFLGLRVAE